MPQWLTDLLDNVDPATIIDYLTLGFGALALLVVGWIAAGVLGRLATRGLRRARLEETLARFIGKLVKWAVLLFVLLGCVGMFGVDVTAFAAVIAAAGFAIGLAFQGTLSNFAAGVMLLVFRPFKVGDVVTVAGQTGKVHEIDLFVTCLDTFDNRRFIIPNSSVSGSIIENVTYHPNRRVEVLVGTPYRADIDETRAVLLAAAAGVPHALEDPPPAVILTGLGPSSVDWSVRVWVPRDQFMPTKDALTRAVKYTLEGAGIGIPFPQMDVHLSRDAAE